MIDSIFEWICGIAVYMVFITMILQIVPKKFRRYVNFFAGMLLIIVVINPVSDMFGVKSALAEHFKIGEMRQQLYEMQDMISLTENIGEERLISDYSGRISANISEMIKKYGFKIDDIQIEWNLDNTSKRYGSIENIYMVLEKKRTEGTIKVNPIKITLGQETLENIYTEKEIKEMKKMIAEFYNMEEQHINIMIQG